MHSENSYPEKESQRMELSANARQRGPTECSLERRPRPENLSAEEACKDGAVRCPKKNLGRPQNRWPSDVERTSRARRTTTTGRRRVTCMCTLDSAVFSQQCVSLQCLPVCKTHFTVVRLPVPSRVSSTGELCTREPKIRFLNTDPCQKQFSKK